MGNPKKSLSTVLFIHTSDYLGSFRRKQTIIHLPTPPENVTTLTCELQNFFIWLKVCCVLSNFAGSEESQLWVVIGGSENNRLWCVATGMSGKQRDSKCSEWPPSALIHASSFSRHWSVSTYNSRYHSALETFVIIALYKSTFTIPYHTTANDAVL